ncbi:MAG: MarR family transcriptional regulator [Trueperella sp.]|nr:MarR family transcriptional regulator [Trueperella sp.]
MTNWLDDSEQQAWRAFLQGSAQILDSVNRDMGRDSGLSFNEYEILVLLSEAPNRQLRMSTLAQHLVHSRSRLTHAVNRLEKAGYVERFPCADDLRGINCSLTDAGFAKLERSAADHVESVRRNFLDLITREEFLELGRIHTKLLQASDPEAI